MNTKPTMTPREQRDLLFAIREQDAPSPYTLAVNGTIETDKINEHFTLCEAAPDLLAALEAIITEWKTSTSGILSGGKILIATAAVKKAKGDK